MDLDDLERGVKKIGVIGLMLTFYDYDGGVALSHDDMEAIGLHLSDTCIEIREAIEELKKEAEKAQDTPQSKE